MPKFFEEARGAYRKSLAKLAAEDSDDGKEARSALAEMDKDEEKKAKKAKAAEEKEEADAKAEGEKDEADAKAAASAEVSPPPAASPALADPSLALAAQHQATLAELNALKAKQAAQALAEEKAKLLATRPDFDNAPRAVLASSPIETIRAAVRDFPKPAVVTNDPTAGAAATTPGATRGKGDAELNDGDWQKQFVGESLTQFIDRKMGMATEGFGVRKEGRNLEIGFMSPQAARAKLVELEKKAANKENA